jgi:hypothetical protein
MGPRPPSPNFRVPRATGSASLGQRAPGSTRSFNRVHAANSLPRSPPVTGMNPIFWNPSHSLPEPGSLRCLKTPPHMAVCSLDAHRRRRTLSAGRLVSRAESFSVVAASYQDGGLSGWPFFPPGFSSPLSIGYHSKFHETLDRTFAGEQSGPEPEEPARPGPDLQAVRLSAVIDGRPVAGPATIRAPAKEQIPAL